MNLFPESKVPYFIYTPSYTHTSSGVRTLHLLCHALNEMGSRAYLYPDNPVGFASNPNLNTPVLIQKPEWVNYYTDFIAVYSDIVQGNPLGAKKVVRYLLAPAGQYGGPSVFPESDMIWGVMPSIAENVLLIPTSDPNVFFDTYQLRQGSCFYAHKYDKIHGNELLPITKDSIRLEGSLEEIADILRGSEVCYSYEPSSIMTEAALCGCPVIAIRTPYFNHIPVTPMLGNVRWDDGEVVKQTDNYYAEYKTTLDSLPSQLKEFVRKTHDN